MSSTNSRPPVFMKPITEYIIHNLGTLRIAQWRSRKFGIYTPTPSVRGARNEERGTRRASPASPSIRPAPSTHPRAFGGHLAHALPQHMPCDLLSCIPSSRRCCCGISGRFSFVERQSESGDWHGFRQAAKLSTSNPQIRRVEAGGEGLVSPD